MLIPNDKQKILKKFLKKSDFRKGSIVLDLDGTAILEEEGKVFISGSVGHGLQEIVKTGRPVILNTLRFPLSVIRTVAKEWLMLSDQKIPGVFLNGSIIGYIEGQGDDIIFEEVSAFTLTTSQIEAVISGLSELLHHGVRDMVLFYYPRDWRKGEIIWVPDEERVNRLKERYESASEIKVLPMDQLQKEVIESDPCMMFILVDRPKDKLMAYQHKEPSSFFTRSGVDKAHGLKEFANILDISLPDSIGAGNTEMDNFLSSVGLAVTVGHEKLSFRGIKENISLHDPIELGDFMVEVAKSYSAIRNNNKDENISRNSR